MSGPEVSEDWLRRKLTEAPEEPGGCEACGALAGCCDKFPNCPGNAEWKPEAKE